MTSRTEELQSSTPILTASLTDPWDVRWLASEWPEVFSVYSDGLGIIEVHDIWEGFKLSGKVEICSDEEGEMLWVNGIPHELSAA